MIRELVNFAAALDEEFKMLGSLPKEGIHVLLHIKKEDQRVSIDMEHFEYEQFYKSQKEAPSDFLNKCKLFHQNAWCIDTNKCFDLPTKAIHTCSPLAVGFKREHLEGGVKFNENQARSKRQINERFGDYFNRAFELFKSPEEAETYKVFSQLFTSGEFNGILLKIGEKNIVRREALEVSLQEKKEELKQSIDEIQKGLIKESITEIEQQLLKVKPLEDSNYIIFYVDVPLETYRQVHTRYLDDKLFNKADYNTVPDEQGVIYGTNNFMNTFNDKMPFLMHQTASFDISGRISNRDARLLNDLLNVLPNKTLPNPLPIFLYKDELERMIPVFREGGNKIGYKDMIDSIAEYYKQDAPNYYLLFWQNTVDGIVFRDFDYVSGFEYSFPQAMAIQNLFGLKGKNDNSLKRYPLIKDAFDMEQQVFKPLLQNRYHKLDYFGEFEKELYTGHDLTFSSFCKYRKMIYDYVYKSRRNVIDGRIWDEMAFNAILDDVKKGNKYEVKEKLNIWYSLYDFFNNDKSIDMINKLKEYQDFVTSVIKGESPMEVTDEKVAFAAGQLIEYLHSKSESADTSYKLLEPYLQQSKYTEFKASIVNDFNRYKHEEFSRSYQYVAALVLAYETDSNIRKLMPQFLSGVFAKNQLFSSSSSK
ncbi:hypothetical protein [Chitinophaga solisilvae]|uniref:hypothetical protein n=1 Tax=Chitinophaga solisilvae TaxID=1233460 RepID=UPI001369E818|nr:hypothetical protein [Chitinophaga solisilvae]